MERFEGNFLFYFEEPTGRDEAPKLFSNVCTCILNSVIITLFFVFHIYKLLVYGTRHLMGKTWKQLQRCQGCLHTFNLTRLIKQVYIYVTIWMLLKKRDVENKNFLRWPRIIIHVDLDFFILNLSCHIFSVRKYFWFFMAMTNALRIRVIVTFLVARIASLIEIYQLL